MRLLSAKQIVVLLADLLLLLFSLLGIYFASQKAALPFSIVNSDYGIIINSPEDHHLNRSEIVSLDGYNYKKIEEVEFHLDGLRINERVTAVIKSVKGIAAKEFTLVPFYSKLYKIFLLFTGVIFFAIALFVYLKSSSNKAVNIFHWVTIFTAVLMMTTWGSYRLDDYGLGVLLRLIFHASYAVTPALFFHFALVFPVDRSRRYSKVILSFYAAAVLLTLLSFFVFIRVYLDPSYFNIAAYINWFDLFRLFIAAAVLAGIGLFIVSYKKTENKSEKDKIKWLLFGFVAGPLMFILLWVIPQAFTDRGLVPEEVILLLMIFVPLTFGISIFKYRLLDIDLIFNRSTVYSNTILIFVTLYILIMYFTAQAAISTSNNTHLTAVAAAALISGLVFGGFKNQVQAFVDRRLFKTQYNFRLAHERIIEDIKDSATSQQLAANIITSLPSLLNISGAAVYFKEDEGYFMQAAEINIDLPEYLPGAFIETAGIKEYYIYADGSFLESQVKYMPLVNLGADFAPVKLLIPLFEKQEGIIGFVLAGRKESGVRFCQEDIDILIDLGTEAMLTLKRLGIQKKLLITEELSKLKTFFVSSVSHELKTPLTSIRLFAQMMKNNPSVKTAEYLNIIEGETERLSRLIDNVLNYAKIERGIKSYIFNEVDLNAFVCRAGELIKHYLELSNVQFSAACHNVPLLVNADQDALSEILNNLLSNAVKYSPEDKRINIRVFRESDYACFSVQDNGYGISPEQTERIFEPFFRADETNFSRAGGTGLGLAVVKHAIDAHGGTIVVNSEINKGTIFTVKIPLLKK